MNEKNEPDLYDLGIFEENLRKNLRFLRKKAKLSQEELAEKFDITNKAFSKYEGGKSEPQLKILLGLCNLYHVHLDDLLMRCLEETGGITTTENLLTDLETKQLNQALSEAIFRDHEKVDTFDYGALHLSFYDRTVPPRNKEYSVDIPFADLQKMFAAADHQRHLELKKQLRIAMDICEYRCFQDPWYPNARRMAEIMGIPFDEYAEKYELLWRPLLLYFQVENPYVKFDRPRPGFANCNFYLRQLRTIQEPLLILYFTGHNPFAYIQDELLEIHKRLTKKEIFFPRNLYRKVRIAIFGDHNYSLESDAKKVYEEMKQSGHPIDCFQNISPCYAPSKELDLIYIRELVPEYAEAFAREGAEDLHSVISDIFLQNHGERRLVAEALAEYFESTLYPKLVRDGSDLIEDIEKCCPPRRRLPQKGIEAMHRRNIARKFPRHRR